MVRRFIFKIKNIVIPLKVSILFIFITLFFVTIFLLIGFFTLRFEKLLEYTSFSLMDQVSLSVLEDIENELNPVQIQNQFTAELINHNVFDPDNENQIVNYTTEMLKTIPIVQRIVWGNKYGNFVISYRENDGTITTEIINRVSNPPLHEIHKRNSEGKIIKRITSQDFNFDPRSRPWYINAKNEKKTVWTDIIKLELTTSFALTVSTPIFYKDGALRGVFGLGIRLEDLLSFISHQKITSRGFSFIVTKNGKIVTFPNEKSKGQETRHMFLFNIHSISKPWLAKSLDLYNLTGKESFTLTYKGEKYLFNYRVIPSLAEYGWLVGVVVPESDFTNGLSKINFMTTLDSIIILIICLILVSSFVNKIVSPIKKLVKEANKIKHFDLSGNIHIKSRIKEVVNLSESLQALKKGLISFQKYVPKTLVNQLIETKEDTRVGGVRKELTIFFSDIKNFTSIAETMNPNQLMIYMCEYFEEISKIISENRGTIDKYIGDSIMAFWGAPLSELFPTYQAAKSAVECNDKLEQLNQQWSNQGRPPLITRIGLHVGDAIVGNLGSSERLNYTALGDAINIANRLEKLNKIYGTKIIISEKIYRSIKNQFITRMIDCVMVKGKMNSSNIYELICENTVHPTYNISEYNMHFSQGYSAYQLQQWKIAIQQFTACLMIYPNDTVAPIFIKRCEYFNKFPPSAGWDGIWKLTE